MLRTAQQGPEALRASAVEAAFTERRRGEAGREIAIEPRDRFVRTGVRDDAIAVGEEARGAKRGVMSHGALPHAAWANGATIVDRKSKRLNSRHLCATRIPSSAWKQTNCSNRIHISKQT